MSNKTCPNCKAVWPVFLSKTMDAGKGKRDAEHMEDVCTQCDYRSLPYPVRTEKSAKEEVIKHVEVIATVKVEKVKFKFDFEDVSIGGEMGRERFLNMFHGLFS